VSPQPRLPRLPAPTTAAHSQLVLLHVSDPSKGWLPRHLTPRHLENRYLGRAAELRVRGEWACANKVRVLVWLSGVPAPAGAALEAAAAALAAGRCRTTVGEATRAPRTHARRARARRARR
jgi:hypothetical protein